MKSSVIKRLSGLALALILAGPSAPWAATKDTEMPDKEMLKMIEFLREMEMLKQMEMMRELDRAESLGEPIKSTAPVKSAAAGKKESPK